jgi:cytochrome c-type biogenesis protein CcmH/NrfF
MLQRFFVHFSLILLFAFTQMGVATHEISHLSDGKQQQQQDKNNHKSQCEQCLSYSHAANAPLAHSFTFAVAQTEHVFVACKVASTTSASTPFYNARAPPITSQA